MSYQVNRPGAVEQIFYQRGDQIKESIFLLHSLHESRYSPQADENLHSYAQAA